VCNRTASRTEMKDSWYQETYTHTHARMVSMSSIFAVLFSASMTRLAT
jgi:hypothetical protein